jgi:Tfp pilus assembly protein PilX
MTHLHRPRSRRTSRRHARQKREGAALLIVLFVLMMATTTAVFAMQSTQFEQRAAGALQQAMRTKYVSEAATNGVLAVCLERTTAGCADGTHADSKFGATERQKYGLPDVGTFETVSSLTRDDIAGATWNAPADTATQTSADVLLPTDAMLIDATAPASTIASSYRPSFVTSVEKWTPTNANPALPPDKYRLVISTYGALALPTDTALASGELRAAHETISATRAFFDVR